MLRKFIYVFIALNSGIALGVPLDTWPTWSVAQPYVSKSVPPGALMMRCKGLDVYCVAEIDQTTGEIPVSLSGAGITIDYSGPTGSAVPAHAAYVGGINPSGNLTGIAVDSSGRTISVGAGTAGTPTGGVTSVQGVSGGTAVPISGSVSVSNFPATQPVSGTVAATQSGTWNIATLTGITNALPAGTNLLGKVGIDQTTPGTTNGVQVNAALPAGTAVIGKIGIDQTTPGTTNGVVVNSTTTTTAVFQAEGSLAFGSITTSFATIITPSAGTKILQMRNNTSASIAVSMDAGVTTNYVLDSGDSISLDLNSDSLNMGATAVQIKYTGSAPTFGTFHINAVH